MCVVVLGHMIWLGPYGFGHIELRPIHFSGLAAPAWDSNNEADEITGERCEVTSGVP
jgi:hypothetical protein